MLDLYEQIYSLNVTWQNDNATMNELRSQGYNLSLALVQEPVNRELSGILWLYPSAVSVHLKRYTSIPSVLRAQVHSLGAGASTLADPRGVVV